MLNKQKLFLQICKFRIRSNDNFLEFEFLDEEIFHLIYVRRYLIQVILFYLVILLDPDQPSYRS